MKTSVKTFALLSISILLSSFSSANPSKTLEPIEKQNIEFSFLQFCNYLENGNAHPFEGVYASPDNRYKVAIVKNDAKHHDYIGIVISADNKYWATGDVKFNFVMEDEALIGYYYNSSGKEFPIQFKIVSDTLETNFLKKMP